MEIVSQIRDMALGDTEKCGPPPGAFFKGKETVLRRRYRLPAGFTGFQGHFEGNPVLPALAQIQLARDAAEQSLGRSLSVSRIAQAKFLAPVTPESVATVFFASPAEKGGNWLFQIFSESGGAEGGTEAARLKIAFEDAAQ